MNCPACGAPNRAEARFCAHCRAPLPPTTVKVCPRCARPNRLSAQFCVGCGHAFATPARARPALPARYAASALILLVGIALFGAWLARRGASAPADSLPTPAETSPPLSSGRRAPSTPPAGLDRALLATVQVLTPIDGSRQYAMGSGSVITARGHILTNLHILVDEASGRFHNDQGIVFIAVNAPELKDPPAVRYRARAARVDRALDLALLEIVARQDGGELPADLGLTTMPVGDSDAVRIGSELSIIGFPGVGGATVTFTRGTVAGFLPDEGWIKTDAEINAGNSGGAAIDRSGALVGIPTMATTEEWELPGKLGLVRPVNLARPLIDWALEQVEGR